MNYAILYRKAFLEIINEKVKLNIKGEKTCIHWTK